MTEFNGDELIKSLERFRNRKTPVPGYKELLVASLKKQWPYPHNPVCSSAVSVNLVREALDEAGYKDFQLYVHPFGIFIEPKGA